MSNPIIYLVIVAAAFLLAGLVKGVTGLALPTVGVGLLSLAMPPAHAAALIVVPALITNLWQMITGPGLWSLVRRLWPMQLGICLGTCLSFTVATIALASSLVSAGTLNLGTGLYSLLALVPALAGMIAGQHLLRVMRPETFRRWFFSGLALLGAHLAIGVLW